MKTILVTGGNRGIGLGIAASCAKLGHDVIVCSRDLKSGQDAIHSLEGKITVKQLDVDRPDIIEKLTHEIKKEFGSLDVLINNSGVICSGSDATDVDLFEVKQIFETNFFGPWRMIQQLIPLLKKSTDPRIINVSSGMGALKDLVGGYAGYRLSKSALNALTIQLSHELEGEISVNAICPGWVRTEMGGANAPRSIEEGAETAVWLATKANIPTGKFFRDRKIIDW